MQELVNPHLYTFVSITMSIPLLAYAPSSQNQRVAGFELPGDEHPKIYTTDATAATAEINELIWAAYRQIFNEQQILVSNRQLALESQLKNRSITVRDFIRGLTISETFRLRNYDTNNNYRFVEMCVQRLLGRNVYSQQETISWSIILATKGLHGFINALLNSEEYQTNFGENTVPYQRRRIISQHHLGELPFARFPRYDSYHRQQLAQLGYFQAKAPLAYRWEWQKPPYLKAYQVISLATLYAGFILLGVGAIFVILAYYGVVSL